MLILFRIKNLPDSWLLNHTQYKEEAKNVHKIINYYYTKELA